MDNALTVEGTHLHHRVDEGPVEGRGDLVIARAVPLRSLRLGLTGRGDVVEFVRCREDERTGVALPGRPGSWQPVPVEYKRGRPKSHRADEAQLCAQALCLEEMMNVKVPRGALYYGARRRRSPVVFDSDLRDVTERAVERLRVILTGATTPPATFEPKCESCSLQPACLPKVSGRVQEYLSREVHRGQGA